MALTDRHPAEAHSTHHGVDPLGVEPAQEPSADWGWHGNFPLAGPIAGWFTAFALFAMLIGNNGSGVANLYLIGLGTLLVVMLIASHLKVRKASRH
ncbi:MAG: DUF2631 domain-containing protein [Pseudonocardiaceae bacterium]